MKIQLLDDQGIVWQEWEIVDPELKPKTMRESINNELSTCGLCDCLACGKWFPEESMQAEKGDPTLFCPKCFEERK